MDRVLDLLKNLDKEKEVIVATSGGPDSMMLLSVLKSEGFKCVAAHINHKLRKESDDEYVFLKDYCKKNNIIFEGRELLDYESGNFENFAREFRYNFFEELIDKYHAKYLFTAHHGDDLIETILMRITRGSSLKGYTGFQTITKKKNYEIIRPLIYLTKEEILTYNYELDIPYVVDNSNSEDLYTRNRYRHHVLPFLKNEEPLIHERFLYFSKELKEAYSYINNVVNKYLSEIYKGNALNIKEFNKIDDYIKKEILKEIMRILYPDNLYLVKDNNIYELLKIINSNKPNVETFLPGGIKVKKEYDKLIFIIDEENVNTYNVLLENTFECPLGTLAIVDKSDDTSNNVIRLNSKDIKLPLYIRTRKDGDKMTIKNMKGSKKVNNIFIDLKIPKSKRDTWPIVVDANDSVLFIPGLKKSNFDVPINDECDIIVKYEMGGEEYE